MLSICVVVVVVVKWMMMFHPPGFAGFWINEQPHPPSSPAEEFAIHISRGVEGGGVLF